MQNPEVKVFFADPAAKSFGLPKYRYQGDAGIDLHAILDSDDRALGKMIYPGERVLFNSGLRLGLPEGYWGRIVHRSSTERRHRLRVIEGTIDTGFLGPIFTQVANDNSFPIAVSHGDRLAQFILMPLIQGDFQEVDLAGLGTTDRNAKGFGSSGR